MASVPIHSSFRRGSLIFAVFLMLCVVVPLGISSNMWTVPKYDAGSPTIYSIEVVNEFPHDPQAFTQGLLYAGNDTLFESTGMYGKSSVRKVALQTGKVEVLQQMDSSYFGEGLTLIGQRLFQVTWLTETGFIYNRYNLSKFKKFTHQMKDGWGLATDDKVLIGSDGTSTLYKIDPRTLKVISKKIVKFNGDEVHNINELEFINDEVWANVWGTDCIARISYGDGSVLGWILLPKLREELIRAGNQDIDVLNGIAWDRNKNRIFVTGKLWPKLYEIKLQPIKDQLSPGAVEQMCMLPPHNFRRP
ncbi:glutaminyl-peptide cyclotransferase-like [Humulus lupulus]|uniref:glutaminyl-peptide cyclotransferase-like n=1 Tax=Humulus lupulus TaxID=3486 RepID=UPI002B4025F2|nr:glutaminyl-peptide cyclotransferase-like [Humulus lupulus]